MELHSIAETLMDTRDLRPEHNRRVSSVRRAGELAVGLDSVFEALTDGRKRDKRRQKNGGVWTVWAPNTSLWGII